MATQAPSGNLGRLAIAGPSSAMLVRLRGGLIKAAVAQGAQVLALAPDITASGSQSLLKLGAQVQGLQLRPEGFSLLPRRRAVAQLAAQLRDWHPHTVLAVGSVIAPLTVLAARRAKVERVAVLVSEVPKAGLSARMRAAVRAADVGIVHNTADEAALRTLLAGTKASLLRVPGTGADLTIAAGCPMPAPQDPLVFLALARLDRIKGVHDYLEAARLAASKGLNARFLLAGPDGTEAGAVNGDTLARYAASVQYVGDGSDAAAAIREAHIFVSPSHLEGMPPDVLTALAAGRPILATDIPGSRDTVDEMVNGTLVPPADPEAMAEGFARLARNRTLLNHMSAASRAKAERLFSSQHVAATLLDALRIA